MQKDGCLPSQDRQQLRQSLLHSLVLCALKQSVEITHQFTFFFLTFHHFYFHSSDMKLDRLCLLS